MDAPQTAPQTAPAPTGAPVTARPEAERTDAPLSTAHADAAQTDATKAADHAFVLPGSLPRAGDRVGDRTVKGSGVLPFSRVPFRIFRHTGREEVASERHALNAARQEHGKDAEPTATEGAYALMALVTDFYRGGDWVRGTYHDLLALDSEDSTALVRVFLGRAGGND
jgi:hypothetical protein